MSIRTAIRKAINDDGKYTVVKVWAVDKSQTIEEEMHDACTLTIEVQVRKRKRKKS